MGYLNGSQFSLSVSLRYAPATGEIDFLCELFGLVSRILSDSTDGKLSIGTVLIATDSHGGADADIWVHPNDQAWPNSTSARLWFSNESMDISQDYLTVPTIFAHELGHYLFGLRDEYGGGAHCVGKVSRQASLMENYGWGNMTRWEQSPGNLYFNFGTFFP